MNRHPVSRQRYAIRRLAVATVLALGVFGAVKGVASLSEKKASGEEPSAPESVEGSTTPVPAGGGAATTPSTTSAPTTQPERSSPPTEDDPARVLVVGDSDAGTFGPYLRPILDEWGIVDMELDYQSSTGLSRPDAHNWPNHLRDTIAANDPDIIVVTFGGNDAQGISEPCASGEGCSPQWVIGQPSADNQNEWTAAYVERVNEVMDIMLEDPDRIVIWVGIPNAKSEEFTARLKIQDQAVRQALGAYPDAIFVDTWSYFDGVNGGIAELVVDPRDGNAIPVRASDGFHLNEDGARILAIKVADRIESVLADMGADV